MALTASGVQRASEINNTLKGDEALYELEDILTIMNNNPDFSKFITETNFGQEYYEKWSGLIKLIGDDLYQSFANMTHATTIFLENQAKLNGSAVGNSNNSQIGRNNFNDNVTFDVK